jgi:hypothetical protein
MILWCLDSFIELVCCDFSHSRILETLLSLTDLANAEAWFGLKAHQILLGAFTNECQGYK